MARSPFSGTFQPNARPTVATAPDAVVHINGEAEIAGCPQCSRRFDLNRYITSIQTDLSIDSVPGSANISLSVPRHAIDDFYFDGSPVITTMMEVEIFAKGHFLVEGLPQYYPIFWGLVTEVQDNYSGGEHTVSIHCADILKWWELCKMNINPAVTAAAGSQGRSLVGNVFASMNAYDIIYTLASASFGDVLIGTGSIQNFIRDTAETNAALRDMALYWEKRFSKMRSNLVLYGTSGVAVRGDVLFQRYSQDPAINSHVASATIRLANGADGGQMFFDPADERVVSMKTDWSNSGPGGMMQSEYQTKLELANAAKESAGFEFYMDVTGDIVFKPPFYNLDVLGNKPISWIQDIDVIDWDFSESESEVVTQIVMQGDYSSTEQTGAAEEILPFATVTDYHLLRKYGWRSQSYNAEFITDPIRLFFHGLDVLDRINSRRYRGNVSIPLRSELRLGFPIYVAPKDQIWYVSGISHSIQFGGRATTTLQLTSRRTKFIAPRGIGDIKLVKFGDKVVEESKSGTPKTFQYSSRQLSESGVFHLKREGALELPANEEAHKATGVDSLASPLILRHPKTGRIVGYPNVTMVYSRPFSPSDITRVAGQMTNQEAFARLPAARRAFAEENRNRYAQDQREKFTASGSDVMHGKYLHNTYQYGVNAAGVFIYAHDSSPGGGVIREAITVKTENITPPVNTESSKANPQALIRPVSDERGFEVVGHYQYGRRVSLRDGRLIVNGPKDKAKIDFQLALSGDLSSMLTAQSQGLTTISTGYADPAAELAILTPSDAETGAVFPGSESSPGKRGPVFTEVGDEFIDDAPFGSQEQKGVFTTVEASQLSRALSLAEMAVKEGAMVANEDCVCLTGRADLAFMASDYQIKTLSGPSAPDLAALRAAAPFAFVSTGELAALEAEQEAIFEALDAISNRLSDTKEADMPALLDEYRALSAPLLSVREKLIAARKARDEQEANQSYPIQVGSADDLKRRLSVLDASIATVTARKQELENAGQSVSAQQESAELDAEIAQVTAEAKDLELQMGHAQPEEQEALQSQLNALSAKLRSLQGERSGSQASARSLVNHVAEQLRQLESQREALQQELTEQESSRGSSSSIFTQSNAELVGRVEQFLVNLYKTLDEAHLHLEKTLRGDIGLPKTDSRFSQLHQAGISVPTQTPGDINAPSIAPVSEFSPPFSAPERYRLGDPNAAIGAAQSNVEGLNSAWSNFSQNLQAATVNRQLTTEISQDRASISRLTLARDQLIKQRDSSTVVVGDVQKQIDFMTNEIAKLEGQIATNEARVRKVKV